MKRRVKRRKHTVEELEITAFMNLMVALVPFLLITAVFSRMTIIDLNLPAASHDSSTPNNELQLEIIIRAKAIEVADRSGALFQRIERTADGLDYKKLSQALQTIKQRHPDKAESTILSEADISYDTLIQVMDSVRVAETVEGKNKLKVELFPNISIGDAPIIAAGTPP